MKKLLSLLILLSACAAPGERVTVVGINKEGTHYSRSNGAVVGDKYVMTAFHCVNGTDELWVDGMPVDHVFVYRTFPEPIVILRIASEEPIWDEDEIFNIDKMGRHHQIIGPAGPRDWEVNTVVEGDSGSPVVDEDGELIGVISGYIPETKEPFMIRIPRNWSLPDGR